MKKIISLLLIAVLSICLLSCGNKANSIKEFAFGSEDFSSEDEIADWTLSYAEELAKEMEEYSLRPKKWYKIDFESAKYTKTYPNIGIYDGENESSAVEYSEHVKCSGWYLATPYDFEKKYSLSLTYTTKTTTTDSNGEKTVEKYKLSADEVYIEGVTYTKRTKTITEGKNKSKLTEYSTEPFVLDLISKPFFEIDVFELLDKGTLQNLSTSESPSYVKNRKIAFYNTDNMEFSQQTKQIIAQLETKSPYIKGLKFYHKMATITNPENFLPSVNAGEVNEVKAEYDNVLVYKLSVNPSFFGFVSRPNDYYKYF